MGLPDAGLIARAVARRLATLAWIAPLLATAVAFAVLYYGPELVRNDRIRRGLIAFLTASFAIAAVAGLMGALITKAVPVR